MALSVDDLQQELDRLRGSAGGAATGVSQFAGALQGASGGLGNYNRMLQGTSQALGSLAKQMPIAGDAAAAGLNGLSRGLGVSLDMTDRLNRVYMTLGNTGQSLGETQQSLREQGDRFGLAIGLNEQAAQQFAKVMTTNSKDLARLGGTAVMGSKRLGEAFEAMGPVRVALQNIGIAYEEQIEGLADYTRMQTATGRAQRMSTEQLAQGSADYLRKLQDLAAVTGVSRQEQAKAREAALAEQRYGAMMIAEERRAQALERQGRTAEAAAIRKNMEAMQEFTGVVGNMDAELAKGLRDMAAGAVNTPEARKAARTLGGDAQVIVRGLKQGTMSSAEALQRLGKASERHVNSTVKLAQVSGSYSDTFNDITKQEKIAQLARNDIATRAVETERLRERTEKDRASDVARTNIVSNKLRQSQVEAGKVLEGTSEAGLAAADAIGTKLVEVLPTVVDQFNNLATSLTETVKSSNTFGEFLSGLANAGKNLLTPPAAPGGPRTTEDVDRAREEFLRRRRSEIDAFGDGEPAPAPQTIQPQSSVIRLPEDQVQALRDRTVNLAADQVAALKPVSLPTTQAVKIAPDQVAALQPPSKDQPVKIAPDQVAALQPPSKDQPVKIAPDQVAALKPVSLPTTQAVKISPDQVAALRPPTPAAQQIKLASDQLAALKPMSLPTVQQVKIDGNQLRDFQIPSLATPGFGGSSTSPADIDQKIHAQAADITRKYMDLASNISLDAMSQRDDRDRSTPNQREIPQIDLAKIGDIAINRPDIMRVKMPELSLPQAPTGTQVLDRDQRRDENFQQMMNQINTTPKTNSDEPLLAVMNEMLNVQRQQSATMMKMLQVARA
jgi:hypothetical protein